MPSVNAQVTQHAAYSVYAGNSKHLASIASKSKSVDRVCTRPTFGSPKTYPNHPDQLGNIEEYERCLDEVDEMGPQHPPKRDTNKWRLERCRDEKRT